MAIVNDLEKLITRALNDADFRTRLRADTANALKEAGFASDPEHVQAIQSITSSQVQALARAFGHPDASTIN